MKVLCVNTSPDMSFFTKRGLLVNVTHETCDKIFPPIKSGTTTNTDGTSVTLYSPDVRQYLEDTYKNTKYDVIFFEWKPEDYGQDFKYSGGQTFRTKLSNGAYFATIRRGVPNAVIHEMMHILGQILYIDLKKYDAVDQMDSTIVNGVVKYYYKNDTPEDPDSNFCRTWETYKKYLPELNNLGEMPEPVLRLKSTNKEAVKRLQNLLGVVIDGSFGSKTLKALISFQKSKGLTPDGICGAKTWAELKKKL